MQVYDESSYLVSIVIAVYNAASYLEMCMDSIVRQTYKNIEIICVDDGSTDESYTILQKYVAVDNRVHVIRQENLFAGVARNKGLEASSGKYVMFLDADDIFDSKLVEQMVRIVEMHDADIGICKERGRDDVTGLQHDLFAASLDADSVPMGECFSIYDIPDKIFQITDTWVWDKIYRRSFLIERNIRFQSTKVINDAFFCCLAYAEAKRIIALDEVLVTHRTNVKTSLEFNRAPFWHCVYDMLDELYVELSKRELLQTVERSFYNLVAERIVYYIGTITDANFFHEAFEYYNKIGKKRYRLTSYPKGYFHNSYVYEKIIDMGNLSEFEYMCKICRELKDNITERNRNIWCLNEHINCLNEHINCLNEQIDWLKNAKKWYFPIGRFKPGKRILLYGFGDLGKDYYAEIMDLNEIELVGVLDKEYKTIAQEYKDIKLLDINTIFDYEFDYVLIAVAAFSVYEEIRRSLCSMGVAENKIVWFDPKRQVWV